MHELKIVNGTFLSFSISPSPLPCNQSPKSRHHKSTSPQGVLSPLLYEIVYYNYIYKISFFRHIAEPCSRNRGIIYLYNP